VNRPAVSGGCALDARAAPVRVPRPPGAPQAGLSDRTIERRLAGTLSELI
jgi:hypothetical protein